MDLIQTETNNQKIFEWQNIKIKKNKEAILDYFWLEKPEIEEKENFD